MYKRFAYLALLISLVGQFLLSPAMAMPKFLHASSHAQHDIQQQLTTAVDELHSLELTQQANQHTDNCSNSGVSINTNMLNCDTLCELLAAGDCVSHCVSAPAIIEQLQLNLTPPAVVQSLQTGFWSPQTAEQSIVNPPPIALGA